jgi:hypothetical protein
LALKEMKIDDPTPLYLVVLDLAEHYVKMNPGHPKKLMSY